MNTLLPFFDFTKSAECLDDTRLNKQRSDVVQILKACASPPPEDGKEHPAIKMWRGNEPVLMEYGMSVCLEWMARGNADATLKKIMNYGSEFSESSTDYPEWLTEDNEALFISHRANLLRLKPTHYRQFWPDQSDEPPMVWPRSPERAHKNAEQREADRLYKRAVKAKEQLEKAQRIYEEACIAAGVDPENFALEDGAEVVEIGVPDPDVIGL